MHAAEDWRREKTVAAVGFFQSCGIELVRDGSPPVNAGRALLYRLLASGEEGRVDASDEGREYELHSFQSSASFASWWFICRERVHWFEGWCISLPGQQEILEGGKGNFEGGKGCGGKGVGKGLFYYRMTL